MARTRDLEALRRYEQRRLAMEKRSVLDRLSKRQVVSIVRWEVKMTPEAAREILANHNPRNRHISRAQVAKIAADIRAGRYVKTHEAIAFFPNGDLLNGQHQLAAVVDAERPVEMSVCRYVDEAEAEAAWRVIDSARPRTTGDVAMMTGEVGDNGKKRVAVARCIWALENGTGDPGDSRAVQIEMAHQQAEAFTEVASRLGYIVAAPILAAFVWAFRLAPRTVAALAERVKLGEMLGAGEATLYRTVQAGVFGSHTMMERDQAMLKTLRAIEAAVRGEHLARVMAISDREKLVARAAKVLAAAEKAAAQTAGEQP